MATANNFKPLLHRKQWAACAAPLASTAATDVSGALSRCHDQYYYLLRGATTLDIYDPNQDAWGSLASPALGTFAAGACVEHSAIGPSGTATAGTTTTLTTNLTIPIDLRGYRIRINAGPGAGDWRTIASNTLGANSVITVTSAFSTTITSSSTYTLLTGTFYMFGAGTLAASSFRKFDYALQTYSNLSITGLPAAFGTDGALVGTPSIVDRGEVYSFATGTATSATGTTLSNAGKNWATNQWANYQVRITGGTGAGQIRVVTSNTATALTVPTWTINPDATSTYSIEGNEDVFYLIGNAAVTLYRYTISTNTWATITPGVARGGAASTGCLSTWVCGSGEADWADENLIRDGRRIYSWRGAAGLVLDYFDIPSQQWVNALGYGPVTIQPTAGWRSVSYKGNWYIRNIGTTLANALWYKYNFAQNQLVPWNSFVLLTTAGAGVGNHPFVAEYVDGATKVPFLYVGSDNNSFIAMYRCYLGV